MLKKIIILVTVIALFSSCFKEDEMVPSHDQGEVVTVVIPMTQYYTKQVYFNLELGDIVSSNTRSIFDLNFSCDDTSTIIRLNTANFAKAAKTMFENLEDVTDTVGLVWKFDKSDGNPDSTAFGNWISIAGDDTTYRNKVWVINRGIDALGNVLGLKKIKFNRLIGGKYFFTFSNMDNSGKVDDFVEKDNLYYYSQYSFINEDLMQTEPEKFNWDLLFTQYTTLLFTDGGLPYPYLVTGVLQKFDNISIASDTSMVFSDITLSDSSNFYFSTALDKIGYDWKKLVGDVNTGSIYYEIKLNENYIIKDYNSYFYKLRFINFYDPLTGEKGYPTFEYQRL